MKEDKEGWKRKIRIQKRKKRRRKGCLPEDKSPAQRPEIEQSPPKIEQSLGNYLLY